MPIPEFMRVAKGGFTTLAGEIDHVARAAVAALRRELNALTTRVTTAEGDITTVEADFAALETQVNPDILTLQDDQAAFIDFAAVARGVLTIGANVLTGGHALASFRAGDGLAHMTVIAGTSAVAGTTGFLGGMTGVDGDLTISARNDLNRIYVENRIGAVRSYGISFLSMGGGALVDGTWTIV